jgi:hypothetical protein
MLAHLYHLLTDKAPARGRSEGIFGHFVDEVFRIGDLRNGADCAARAAADREKVGKNRATSCLFNCP